ncbi:hypothetical protein FB567DRAFT_608076 [Paraphoma chrysanthemicola]|uniref:Uncharacterized protein n=1 Tax=Paraphoma chrysanthemicola TaxID=798071 RepID=A0A8K0VUE6_9PLEO|nr:hypothetical protein FB567DRAFT_608076 [Paraphoma chrysanthemicola]
MERTSSSPDQDKHNTTPATDDPIAPDKTTAPPFFGLPLELCNMIYDLLLNLTPSIRLSLAPGSAVMTDIQYANFPSSTLRSLPIWLLTSKAWLAEGLAQLRLHATWDVSPLRGLPNIDHDPDERKFNRLADDVAAFVPSQLKVLEMQLDGLDWDECFFEKGWRFDLGYFKKEKVELDLEQLIVKVDLVGFWCLEVENGVKKTLMDEELASLAKTWFRGDIVMEKRKEFVDSKGEDSLHEELKADDSEVDSDDGEVATDEKVDLDGRMIWVVRRA